MCFEEDYSLIEERWVIIEEFPRYAVSDHGRIQNIQSGRILKPWVNTPGYLSVYFNNRKLISIHRLVAFLFVDGYFEEAEVNHKDGIKTNNYFRNLEWVTSSNNRKHAYDFGLRQPRRPHKQIRCKETGEIFLGINAVAEHFNICRKTVFNNLNGHVKISRQGYNFELVD